MGSSLCAARGGGASTLSRFARKSPIRAGGVTYTGIENVRGGIRADLLVGDANANTLEDGAGDDRLFGQDGNDILIGGAGRDVLRRGAGIDTLSYAAATSFVNVSLKDGAYVYGAEALGDVFSGFENLTGGKSGDRLYGDDGVNLSRGGDGRDFVDGGGGVDRLFGDAGDDTFYFGTASGRDVIYDFVAGAASYEDRLLLDLGPSFQSFASVMAAATTVNGNTVFNFGAGLSVTLLGVDKSSITANDIAFPEEEWV